ERDGKLWDPVKEVRGAVKRIHDPAVRAIRADLLAALFTQEAVGGARLHQLVPYDLFCLQVRLGDEVAGSLDRDLQVLHLAEIARKRFAGLDGSLNHDVEKSGTSHAGKSLKCGRLPRIRLRQDRCHSQ